MRCFKVREIRPTMSGVAFAYRKLTGSCRSCFRYEQLFVKYFTKTS